MDSTVSQFLLLVGVFLIITALRLPVFLAVILSTVSYTLIYPHMPDIALVQTMLSGLDKPAFAAIPYYFLLGSIMGAGGMTTRLLRLARALFSWFRGGLAHVNIGASMLFGGISGSAVADASAIGSLMIPAMKKDGFPAAYAGAVTASSASIGLLIPPSIPMVMFGLFNNVSVGDLFLAGILPGVLMGIYLSVAAWWTAKRRQHPQSAWSGWGEVWNALKDSVLVLVLPVLITVSLYAGIATPTEVGAAAVVYTVVVSVFVYKDISLAMLIETILASATESAQILSIIAVSGGALWIFANMGAADALIDNVSAFQFSVTQLLYVIAFILVIAGTVVGPGLLMILVIPPFTTLAVANGIDVLHFAVVAVFASAVGLVTPPVGILLFLTASQSGASIMTILKEMVPFYIALILLLISLIYFPVLSVGVGQLL
ncbi:MAG: TRAP transporter large permease [Thiolinea sp.]